MEKLTICKKCKGACCKTMGCHYSPNDFKEISFQYLKSKIDEGNISIDWWEGSPFDDNDRTISKAYYLRARHTNANVVDAAWGGTCKLLTPKGCSLTYKDRPKGGRLLIPCENRNCIPEYTKQQAAIDWYKYNDILTKLVNHYRNTEEDKSTDFFFDKLAEMLNSFVDSSIE